MHSTYSRHSRWSISLCGRQALCQATPLCWPKPSKPRDPGATLVPRGWSALSFAFTELCEYNTFFPVQFQEPPFGFTKHFLPLTRCGFRWFQLTTHCILFDRIVYHWRVWYTFCRTDIVPRQHKLIIPVLSLLLRSEGTLHGQTELIYHYNFLSRCL